MAGFRDVKIGDVLTRAMDGWHDGDIWRWDATVIDVTATEIVCRVMVDVPRTMRFDRETGVNLIGRGYGWLERENTETAIYVLGQESEHLRGVDDVEADKLDARILALRGACIPPDSVL